MSNGFTPGPWRIDNDRYWLAIVGPREKATRLGVKGEWEIAGVRDDWPDKGQANAHLIKAAPDLYAALSSLVANLAEGDFTSETRIAAARQALARARGET